MQDRRGAVKPALLAVVLAAALGATAHAGLPDPGSSFASARVVVCPGGDSMLVVAAAHMGGDPWSEGPLTVDFCHCPGFVVSPAESLCAATDTTGCRVTIMPDRYGVAEFPLSGGGLCPGGQVWVRADGLVIAVRGEPACFDQNGDLRVDEADVAIVSSKLGTADPGADFNGDGTVNLADLAILRLHLGHAAGTAGL